MIEAWFDGACWPNPGGPAAAGALVKLNGNTIFRTHRFIEGVKTSNNVAEYEGLILILEFLRDRKFTTARIFGDSNLVIKQMAGLWSVKRNSRKPKLYVPFYDRAQRLAQGLTLTFQWIPREENTEADELSNQPLIDRGIRNPYK